MSTPPVNVGVVGCGTISNIYLQNCAASDMLNVVACADLDAARAEAQATAHGVPRACSVAELLADPAIELILNLTIPAAHYEVGMAALEAGKSLYNEKPLAIGREEGRKLVDLARARGLWLGCAPDTFLGGGLQTCRTLLDAGAIGQPVAATAFMLSRGPEHWHPSPEFFYRPGAGPLFDIGPYYLTALVMLLGPVRRVGAAARISFAERTITSEPLYGRTIEVTTPTHVSAHLEFASGAIGTLITSFDVWAHQLPRIEIYGSAGTLQAPDPNTFDGPVHLWSQSDRAWSEADLTHGFTANSRGIGLIDMAHAMRGSRPQRASGTLAYHILDTMHAILESSEQSRFVEISSTCERPAPLPAGWPAEQAMAEPQQR